MLPIRTKVIFKKKTEFTQGDGMESPIYKSTVYTGTTGTITDDKYGDYGIELDGTKQEFYVRQNSEGITIVEYLPEVNGKHSCYAKFACPLKENNSCSYNGFCDNKILKSTGEKEKAWDHWFYNH